MFTGQGPDSAQNYNLLGSFNLFSPCMLQPMPFLLSIGGYNTNFGR